MTPDLEEMSQLSLKFLTVRETVKRFAIEPVNLSYHENTQKNSSREVPMSMYLLVLVISPKSLLHRFHIPAIQFGTYY